MPTGTPADPLRLACPPAQRRLWVLDRMDPGNPALNIAARWRLEGRVAGAELREAFARIVARHAALRTFFVEENGAPVQVIEPAVPFHMAEVDLSTLAEDAALAEVERIAQLEARAPFELSAPPLIRATHVRLRDDLSIVLVTAHQLVCDAGSIGILARELAAICTALHAGQAPDLPKLVRAPAGDPSADALLRDEAWWLETLRNLRHFELPLDRARPPVQTSRGALRTLPLDRHVSEGLQDASRRAGCSLFTTTLAALFTLLHRYSGETDIAIGTQVAGRDEAGLENAVGPFMNTIVLRADLSGDPPFAVVQTRVRDTVVSGLEHRGTPLGRLIELLQPQRDLSRSPLFSINFTLQRPVTGSESGGAFSLVDLPACSAGVLYDLNFFMVDAPDGWRISCEYNADLFEPETIGRLLGHFANLLRAVAAEPARGISSLPMLDPAERLALADAWNQTQAPYPSPATFLKLFDGQAQRTPEAIAVVCGAQGLSYRELDRVSNRLAHTLLDRGAGRGSLVAICLERSTDLVVALLATLKSGAAYVPLDPAYPAARLAQIVADAQPAVVLTKNILRERVAAGGAEPILLDADAAVIARQSDRAPESAPDPDDLAYVIYTSGSTGKPKGVQIQHRALANLLWSMGNRPGLGASDTLVSVTTVSFDIAALELFLPLITGARLVVAREEEVADGDALLKLLRRHRATVLQATPVTWQILLAAGWSADPPLKMLCGGEALSRPLADQLLAHGGELWNLYGPTETTIWSSALRVVPGEGPVPIGPPIANTRFHVLDSHGQLVPQGVPGELFIGGDGLALGYLNLPALTHERFVADPFAPQPGARLYRTGDRVRRRQRGELEFLGRSDQQVKLRGFRIELGEIEAVMLAHPQVAEGVAIAAPDASGETAIRAYVVAHAAPAPSANLLEELRAALRQALPAYMCPASLVVLPALPRLPNGKIDRAALPGPLPLTTRPGAPGRAASALEQRLGLLWGAVLGIAEVSVDANFFEVGGHSLLAVRLLARIEAAFGRKLTLAALFRHPTIAGQARLLEQGDARAFDFRQVVSLQSGGTRPPLIALNNTGIYYALSKHLGPDQPFTSLQLFDPSQPRALLPRTLPDIAAEYAQLIRRVQRNGPYALLGWCVAGTLAFEVARQLRESGQKVSRLILFDTLAPGRLERLPWFAAVLADHSYRWKLIAADWARAQRGERPLATFLSNRTIVRKLKDGLRRPPAAPEPRPAAVDAPFTPEEYDQWLLRYLEDVAATYQPKPYPGSMTLFRSSQEPAGRFLDPQMGWGEFVEGGIDVVVIEGDHFSIFQEPSVSQVAQRIDSAPQLP